MNENARLIFDELHRLYPSPRPELDFSNPYETLVATILSAQCTDKRVNEVTPALFRDYPNPAAMAAAEPETIHEYVKSCGFKSKAVNIVNACRMIESRFGGEVPHTMEELTSLPGVGRKTANVVLAFAFGIPAFPVDTHVFRLSHRLGLSDGATPEQVEKDVTAFLPREEWSDCAACTLRPWCPSNEG